MRTLARYAAQPAPAHIGFSTARPPTREAGPAAGGLYDSLLLSGPIFEGGPKVEAVVATP
jgi:hypothetical protein